jgi:DNA-directed RNA polymerase specialized sigma24 family protein
MADDPSKSSLFPRTNWAELGRAAEADTASLDRLVRLYWQPLQVFLAATFPGQKNKTDQWLQDFAGDKLIQAGWLRKADQNRGRFRDFLKRSLRNFVLDRLNSAEERHAGGSLDAQEQEFAQPEAQAEAFDLAWVQAVLSETLRRMEADCRQPGTDQPRRGQIWELFQVRLLDPIFNDTPPSPYEELIGRFGLKSPTDASNTLLSAKRIFKVHLGKVIREYAGQDAATAAELQELENFLGRLAGRG